LTNAKPPLIEDNKLKVNGKLRHHCQNQIGFGLLISFAMFGLLMATGKAIF
jgi:hypothetical protein